MNNLGLFSRIWLVLSALWLVVFGLSAWDAWSEANLMTNRYEDVRADAWAENFFESRGVGSYAGAADETEGRLDELRELKNESDSKRNWSIFFLLIGPIAIGAVLRLMRWVALGSKVVK